MSNSIDGLSPAVAIGQKGTPQNPRSTVGTVTEVYDYLRLLYARIGHPHCPKCGCEMSQQTVQHMVDAVLKLLAGSRMMLLASLVKDHQGAYEPLFDEMRRAGYVRVRVDGDIFDLSDEIELDQQQKHTIEVVVDRLVIPREIDLSFRQRVTDSLETTLSLGAGIVQVSIIGGDELLFSEHPTCVCCEISLPEIAPHTFSFNSPHGACPTCAGLGVLPTVDAEHLAATPAMGAKGSNASRVSMSWSGRSVEDEETESSVSSRICPDCQGTRLNPEALLVTVGERTIAQVTHFSIKQAQRFFQQLASDTLTPIDSHEMQVEVRLSERERLIARQLLKEISARLQFLLEMGLDYLSLDRAAASLSGGEAQRIHLATQIGSGLSGVLYILDEPSVGLHPHDNARLLKTLTHLRDQGNSVLVVEHDEETMRASDHIVEMGPGAGEFLCPSTGERAMGGHS